MLSSNFAIAVITIVLRGLLDRILAAVQTPIVKTSSTPSSTSIVVISGILLFLYNRLVKSRKIQVTYPSTTRRKILDGRLHQKDSRSSSGSAIRNHQTWSPRRFRRRSRSQCRNNLLQTAKESLEMLHGDDVSSSSMFSKSGCSEKCRCKDSSVPRTEMPEASPSVYSIKSDGEVPDKVEDKRDDPANQFQGFGDCQWQEHQKNPRRRKRTRSTRKTRSGKIYSSYL
ncbi:hypothetical protein Zmor_009404 [Zophobas morio]|uniref:Uncharacterized protein n=1 Tax=Zophobas morio TaxID=2755281 RepID=A0AA38IIR4_9CUCU|nr:hypothetical protein Zmor_009404 [Zophobas morio]